MEMCTVHHLNYCQTVMIAWRSYLEFLMFKNNFGAYTSFLFSTQEGAMLALFLLDWLKVWRMLFYLELWSSSGL